MARTKGSLNKSTEQVRRAVAELLEMSAPKMIGWLEKVSEGIPASTDEAGQVTNWLVKPEPSKAVALVLQAAEFHIPKLARTESHVSLEEQSHEEWLNGLE
jgi:hypothetical protein